MFSSRTLLVGLLLLGSTAAGAASASKPRPKTTAATEAGNETAAPSFSRHVREAGRIADFLADALVLNTPQRYAVARCTVAEREALLLAATAPDAALAQLQYLQTMRQLLALSQLRAYQVLCQQLDGTNFPLDGTELAIR